MSLQKQNSTESLKSEILAMAEEVIELMMLECTIDC